MITSTSVNDADVRDDIVSKKVVDLDPLLDCQNCENTGVVKDEYHNPRVGTCPYCDGNGRLEESADEFIGRVDDLAPVESDAMRAQRLMGTLARVLQHLESDACELRRDIRDVIAGNMVPGCVTAWSSSRSHNVDVDDKTGEYHPL